MRQSRLRSFTTQLTLLVVFPVLITLIVVASGSVSLHEHAMHSLVGERDERAVRAASEALSDRFAQRQLLLRLLANQLADGVTVDQVLADTPDLRRVFDGGLIAVNGSADIIDSWQPGKPWDTSLRSATSPWVLEHQLQPVMVIANAQSANRQLTLFGGISLTSLNVPGTVGVMKNNPQTRIYLVADDGHIIEDTAEQAIGKLWTMEHATLGNHITSGNATRYDNPDSVMVSSRVEGLGWTLVIQEPWSEVISSDLKFSLIGPLAAVPAVLIAMGVLAFGTVTIVMPLRKLRRLTTRLAWGDYGVVQNPVGGVQEIRDLQTTLSQMAQRLHQAQAGMHSYIGAMLQGQEDERKRISRELHDDTLQSLIALNQQRQMVEHSIEREPAKARQHLDQLSTILDEMIKNLRRIIRDLRPSYIEDLGLVPALEMLSTQTSETAHVNVSFKTEGTPRRLPLNHELSLYRITQEAITNAVRHAGAKSIQIALSYGKEVELLVKDDGLGFILPERPSTFAQAGHYGLMGMVERAEQIGAQFRIDSSNGKGTRIAVCLPI